MADEGADGSSNGTPENFVYMQFADDLVNYVMLKHSPSYVAEREPTQDHELINFFDETIRRPIGIILREIAECNENIHDYIRENFDRSPDSFTSIVDKLLRRDFNCGFKPENFLIHCASISFYAASFFNFGVDTAPELAKSHIVYVLKNLMPANGWYIVRSYAEKYPMEDEL